jgi:hypothetical protein
MRARDIEQITGISNADLRAIDRFHVFSNLGEGASVVGARPTIEAALRLIETCALAGGAPDLDQLEPEEQEVVDQIQDATWKALACMLSNAAQMDRGTDPAKLSYLDTVVKDRPDLRLLVAWEAAPPAQDVAFGIFVGAGAPKKSLKKSPKKPPKKPAKKPVKKSTQRPTKKAARKSTKRIAKKAARRTS